MKKMIFSTLLASIAIGVGTVAFVGGNQLTSANAETDPTWITTIQCDFSQPQTWGGVTRYQFHGWGNGADLKRDMSELSNGLFTCDVALGDSQTLNGGQFIITQNGAEKWSFDIGMSASKASHSKIHSSSFVGNWEGDKYHCADFTTSNDIKLGSTSFVEDAANGQYKIADFVVTDTSTVYNFTIGNKTSYGSEIIKSGCASLISAATGGFTFASAGTYDIYFSSVSNNGFVWISKQAAEVVYTLKVNDAVYDLVKNGDTSEYKTTEDITVSKDDVLACYADGELQTINPKAMGNNNCYSNDGVTTVLLNMTSKIYVDFTAGTIFCGGMTFGKFGMVVNDNYVELSQNDTPVDPTFTEWVKTGVSFAKDDVIRFINNTSDSSLPVIFDVAKINEFSVADSFDVVGGSIKCIADEGVETDVYVKFKYGEDEVYFGSVAEDDAAAREFAKTFNSSFEAICKLDNTTDKSTLASKWAEFATSYGELIEAAQEKIKNTSASSLNADMAAFAEKYDYIYSKYGVELSLVNFAARTVSARGIRVNNNTNITLIVICSITVISFVGFGIFLAKRKKEVK